MTECTCVTMKGKTVCRLKSWVNDEKQDKQLRENVIKKLSPKCRLNLKGDGSL